MPQASPAMMAGGWHLSDGVLDLLPLLEQLIDYDPIRGAELFHGTLVAGLAEWVEEAAATEGLRTVVLAGGCFLNRVLTEGLIKALENRGLVALLPRQAPPNDGGLSLGQVWVAANISDERREPCV